MPNPGHQRRTPSNSLHQPFLCLYLLAENPGKPGGFVDASALKLKKKRRERKRKKKTSPSSTQPYQAAAARCPLSSLNAFFAITIQADEESPGERFALLQSCQPPFSQVHLNSVARQRSIDSPSYRRSVWRVLCSTLIQSLHRWRGKPGECLDGNGLMICHSWKEHLFLSGKPFIFPTREHAKMQEGRSSNSVGRSGILITRWMRFFQKHR